MQFFLVHSNVRKFFFLVFIRMKIQSLALTGFEIRNQASNANYSIKF